MRKIGGIANVDYVLFTHDDFLSRYRNKRPVIIRNFLSTWPSKENWDVTGLIDIVPKEKQVEVYFAKDGTHFLNDDLVVERVNMEFGTVMRKIFTENEKEDQTRCYLSGLLLEELATHVTYPTQTIFGKQPEKFTKKNTMIWIGTKGNITPLHFDRCHGILCQLKGSKDITIFRPKDTRNLYPKSPDTGRSHTTHLNVEKFFNTESCHQELLKYPKVSRAKPYKVTLNQGECIYIPPGWWHHVVHNDNSISLTLSWDIDFSLAQSSSMNSEYPSFFRPTIVFSVFNLDFPPIHKKYTWDVRFIIPYSSNFLHNNSASLRVKCT